MKPRRLPRTLLAMGCLFGSLLVGADARALGAAACEAIYERAQERALEGHLLAARATFAECAQESCPSLLRVECSRRLDATAARVPSVVFAAHALGGDDLVDVAIDIDGVRVSSKITGKAIEVDPGHHVVRMTFASGVVDEFDVVAREGDKLRAVVREQRPQPKDARGRPAEEGPPARTEATAVPWTVYALGAVGAVGFGSFAFFGLRGASDSDALHAECAPGCSAGAERGVRDQLIVADVSLGVGIVATAAALWLFFGRRPATPSHTAAPAQPLLRF